MTRQHQILAALAVRDMTAAEIAVELGISRDIASASVGVLKGKKGIVHICSWADDQPGPLQARYRIGEGKDASRDRSALRRAALRRASEARRTDVRKTEREAERETLEVARHPLEIAMHGGPASVAVRIPPVPVEAWEAA